MEDFQGSSPVAGFIISEPEEEQSKSIRRVDLQSFLTDFDGILIVLDIPVSSAEEEPGITIFWVNIDLLEKGFNSIVVAFKVAISEPRLPQANGCFGSMRMTSR